MVCCVAACMRTPPGERAAIAELAAVLDNTCRKVIPLSNKFHLKRWSRTQTNCAFIVYDVGFVTLVLSVSGLNV